MSVISDRHQFMEFVSGESKPFTLETGEVQRLAKVGYKAKSGKKSVCVSIPRLSDGEVSAIHAAFPMDIRKRVEDMQDGLIRALYEGGKSEITSSEISESQIRAFVEATSSSDRLSAELVGKWWDGFTDTAMPVLSEKYKTEDTKVLEQKANAWKGAFQSICGRNPITRERIAQLLDMLEYSEEDDVMATRIAEKLQSLVREFDTMDAL